MPPNVNDQALRQLCAMPGFWSDMLKSLATLAPEPAIKGCIEDVNGFYDKFIKED